MTLAEANHIIFNMWAQDTHIRSGYFMNWSAIMTNVLGFAVNRGDWYAQAPLGQHFHPVLRVMRRKKPILLKLNQSYLAEVLRSRGMTIKEFAVSQGVHPDFFKGTVTYRQALAAGFMLGLDKLGRKRLRFKGRRGLKLV